MNKTSLYDKMIAAIELPAGSRSIWYNEIESLIRDPLVLLHPSVIGVVKETLLARRAKRRHVPESQR